MGRLTLKNKDAAGTLWTLRDKKNLKAKTGYNGFLEATWDLPRDFSFGYEDLGLGSQIFALSESGDLAWHGYLENIEPKLESGISSIGCTAVGFWAGTYELDYTGTLSNSASPESMLGSLLGSTYLPKLSTSSAGLLTTGHTTKSYQTGNGGTDRVPVGDVIQEICKSGTSDGRRVLPAVWENRLLTTYALALTPTADYIVKRSDVKISLRRALSSVYNRIYIRYKDANGNLQTTMVEDGASQSALAIDYGSGAVNYIRSKVLDITGLKPTDAAGAQAYGNAELSQSKRVKNDSQSIVIPADYSLREANGQEFPNWAARGGKWLAISDLFTGPNSSGSGSGTSAGDAALSTLFLISQTEYDDETGALTITPENSSALADLLGGKS